MEQNRKYTPQELKILSELTGRELNEDGTYKTDSGLGAFGNRVSQQVGDVLPGAIASAGSLLTGKIQNVLGGDFGTMDLSKKLSESSLQQIKEKEETENRLSTEAKDSISATAGSLAGGLAGGVGAIGAGALAGGLGGALAAGTAFGTGQDLFDFRERRRQELINNGIQDDTQINQILNQELEENNLGLKSLGINAAGNLAGLGIGGLVAKSAQSGLGGLAKGLAAEVPVNFAEGIAAEYNVASNLDEGFDLKQGLQAGAIQGVVGGGLGGLSGFREGRANRTQQENIVNQASQELSTQPVAESRLVSNTLSKEGAEKRLKFLQDVNKDTTIDFEVRNKIDENNQPIASRFEVFAVKKQEQPIEDINTQNQVNEIDPLTNQPIQSNIGDVNTQNQNSLFNNNLTETDLRILENQDSFKFDENNIPRNNLGTAIRLEDVQNDINTRLQNNQKSDEEIIPTTFNPKVDENTNSFVIKDNTNKQEFGKGVYNLINRIRKTENGDQRTISFESTIQRNQRKEGLPFNLKELKPGTELSIVKVNKPFKSGNKEYDKSFAIYAKQPDGKSLQIGFVDKEVAKEFSRLQESGKVDNIRISTVLERVPKSKKSIEDPDRLFVKENGKEVILRPKMVIEADWKDTFDNPIFQSFKDNMINIKRDTDGLMLEDIKSKEAIDFEKQEIEQERIAIKKMEDEIAEGETNTSAFKRANKEKNKVKSILNDKKEAQQKAEIKADKQQEKILNKEIKKDLKEKEQLETMAKKDEAETIENFKKEEVKQSKLKERQNQVLEKNKLADKKQEEILKKEIEKEQTIKEKAEKTQLKEDNKTIKELQEKFKKFQEQKKNTLLNKEIKFSLSKEDELRLLNGEDFTPLKQAIKDGLKTQYQKDNITDIKIVTDINELPIRIQNQIKKMGDKVNAFMIDDPDVNGGFISYYNLNNLVSQKFNPKSSFYGSDLADIIKYYYGHEVLGHGGLARKFETEEELRSFLGKSFNESEIIRLLTNIKANIYSKASESNLDTLVSVEEVLADLASGHVQYKFDGDKDVKFYTTKEFFDKIGLYKEPSKMVQLMNVFKELFNKVFGTNFKITNEKETIDNLIKNINDMKKELAENKGYKINKSDVSINTDKGSYKVITRKELDNIDGNKLLEDNFNDLIDNMDTKTIFKEARFSLERTDNYIDTINHLRDPRSITTPSRMNNALNKVSDIMSTLVQSDLENIAYQVIPKQQIRDVIFKTGFDMISKAEDFVNYYTNKYQEGLKGLRNVSDNVKKELSDFDLIRAYIPNKKFEEYNTSSLSKEAKLELRNIIDTFDRMYEDQLKATLINKFYDNLDMSDKTLLNKEFDNITSKQIENFLLNKKIKPSQIQTVKNNVTKDINKIIPVADNIVYKYNEKGLLQDIQFFDSKMKANLFLKEQARKGLNYNTLTYSEAMKSKNSDLANQLMNDLQSNSNIKLDFEKSIAYKLDNAGHKVSQLRNNKLINDYIRELELSSNPKDVKIAGRLKKINERRMEKENEIVGYLKKFNALYNLGGVNNLMSSLINLSSTITTTLPYLSQYKGGAGNVGKAFAIASRIAYMETIGGRNGIKPDILIKEVYKELLKNKNAKGKEKELLQSIEKLVYSNLSTNISDYEIRNLKLSDSKFQNFKQDAQNIWMKPYAATELFNKVAVTVSSLNTALDNNKNLFDFTRDTILTTQGNYTKIAMPELYNMIPAGQLLYQFKNYSFNYVGLMTNLLIKGKTAEERKAGIMMLGIAIMFGGLGGLPFMDDGADIVDTVSALGGNPINTRQEMREIFESNQFLQYLRDGLFDTSIADRFSFADMIPGSNLFNPTKKEYKQDIVQALGPSASNISNLILGGKTAINGFLNDDSRMFLAGFQQLAPTSIKSLMQAVRGEDYFVDNQGRKLVEASSMDRFLRSIGYIPSDLKDKYNDYGITKIDDNNIRYIKDRAYTLIARGEMEKKPEIKQSGLDLIKKWNNNNPDMQIKYNNRSVKNRLRAMEEDIEERQLRGLSREVRKEEN